MRWGRGTLVVALIAAAVWVVVRFGLWAWLPADNHPVRNVVEGLSWVAAVVALLPIAAVAARRLWQRQDRAAGATAGGSAAEGAAAEGSAAGSVGVGPVASAEAGRSRLGLFAMGAVPAVISLLAGHPVLALVLFCCSEIIAAVVVFAGGVVDDLGQRWRGRTADWLDHAVTRGTSRFGKRYSEFIVRTLRSIEEQGPATTGFYRPDLDEVFVDVGLVTQAPHLVPTGLLADPGPDPDPAERRSLDEFLDLPEPTVLAVTGAPGSGKTTLLRRTAREVGKHRRRRRRGVPILLYLRDHAQAVVRNPEIDVVALLRRTLERHRLLDPPGWFERRLRAGRCVVLLDGLDEVARQEHRRAVADWVELLIDKYPKNDFVVTSRPQGYLTARIDAATVLQVRSFSDEQVGNFVRRWYLAVERRASNADGEEVRLRAQEAATDLLGRLNQNLALYDLTVNPLLLTMIANVHRYRGALPGSRVDLYGEICEVMLWRRQEAKKLDVDLRGDRKEALLRALAFRMMVDRTRDATKDGIVAEVRPAMRRMSRKVTVEDFLADVTSNGLIVEGESGVFSFAHHTFQEYLAAAHIRDRGLVDVLADGVDDVWWRETTLLYAARSDADGIVQACLASASVTALMLAFDCADQDSELAPELRDRMDDLLDGVYKPGTTPERRRLMAGVIASRHLRRLVRTRDGRRVCPHPVPGGVFWLYRQDRPAPGFGPPVDAEPGSDDPVTGVRARDALGFVRWVNSITGGHTAYRLVDRDEVVDPAVRQVLAPDNAPPPAFTVWLTPEDNDDDLPLWVPRGRPHPHRVTGATLAAHVDGDIARTTPGLLRLLLVRSVLAAHSLADDLERDLATAREKARDGGRTRKIEIDAMVVRARMRLQDKPKRLAAALSRAHDAVAAIGLESALAATIEVVETVAVASHAARVAALERGLELARGLVDELDPDFAHVFAPNRRPRGAAPPDHVMGRALSAGFDRVLRARPLEAGWDSAFARAFVAETMDVHSDRVVPPDGLAERLRRANAVLLDLADSKTAEVDVDDEEDDEEWPSGWAPRAATALQRIAEPVFALDRPLTPDIAATLRLGALCLAAELGRPHTGEVGGVYRQVAAGVTLLELRAAGRALRNETVLLAIS